jgi:hypothetical protein
MKKIILIFAFTILLIPTLQSQEKIQFGLKGGVNFTTMTPNDYLTDEKYKTGLYLGATVEIPLGKKFSIQPEILYSKQGVKGNVPLYSLLFLGQPNPTRPAEHQLDYIKIPVLAKLYFAKNFSLEIGPSFNFLVNDKLTYLSSIQSDLAEKFELGGVVGFSYKVKSNFVVNANYLNGFSNVLKSPFENPKSYGFSVGVGYLFK